MVTPSACHLCGKDLEPDATFCRHCGADVESPDPADVKCTNCGTANSSQNLYCADCGTLLVEPRQKEAQDHSFECPRCGATNHRGALYCYSCRDPLTQQPAPQPAPQPAQTAWRTDPTGPASVSDNPSGRPAGFRIRFLASIIDGFILNIIGAIVFGLAQMAGTSPSDFGVSILIGAAYHIIGWSTWGTTIGKRICRLYVVTLDGSKPDVARSALRYIATILSFLILCIGYLMVAFRQDKRALHDLIAGTRVISRD